jgi:plasmid maintenance system antidote protein VapI
MTILTSPNYAPNHLLNKVMEMIDLESDAALARAIRVDPASISKVRRKVVPLGESMLLRLHELTGLPAKELRKMGGME